MTVGLVSVCVVTLDRYELAVQCVGQAVQKAGWDFELLHWDNGSADKRVVEYIGGLNPVYQRCYESNYGYAPALNQMILRAQGEYICVIDPDLQLPARWLAKLVEVNRAIPNSGTSGYWCVLNFPPLKIVNGMEIRPQEAIHGVKFFNRRLLEKIGYYWNGFTPYGNEEVDMNRRSIMAGFMNYYLGGGDQAVHVGDDATAQTPYRKLKWDSLKHASDVLSERFEYYERTGDYYVPPPEMI